jgi:hypothetical protein
MPTVSFTGVKSCTASDDAIDVVFKTRYSGDLAVKMTRACLGELVAALSQDAGAGAVEAPAPAPAATAKPKPEPQAAANAPVTGDADDNVSVRVPKKWAVAAETKLHNVVLLFFDPKTENQRSFALSPKAATGLADGLAEKAKVVADHLAKQPKKLS